MNNETINVEGNFAAKVGTMWAKRDYSNIELHNQPEKLTSFKDAYELAQKIGGKVYVFKPKELTDEQIADLKLAAAGSED